PCELAIRAVRQSGAWYRQDRHDLHGFTRENREMRVILEQPGGRLVRFGPPMAETATWCCSTQAFQAAMPSCSLARRSASGSAIHAFMRGLVLLPRKT